MASDQVEVHLHEVRVPPDLQTRLAGYSWTVQAGGRSEANVFRLTANGRPTLVLKTEFAGPFCELADEAYRLRWLARTGIACPKVHASAHYAQRNWLLLSALPGRDLASSHLPAARIIEIVAHSLRALHRLDARHCPFDRALDRQIAEARARLDAGFVDQDDFDEERKGRAPVELFSDVLKQRPISEDIVVSHGDAGLPNLLADRGGFTGFVDSARLGRSDRHQDLALASWSIFYRFGEEFAELFLRKYGHEADRSRLAFYRLLDEFF